MGSSVVVVGLRVLCASALWLAGCDAAERVAPGKSADAPAAAPAVAARENPAERIGARWPAVEVVSREPAPSGATDAPPRLQLGFRHADGSLEPIAGAARAFAPFRDGVALVDVEGALVLVSPGGTRRTLAAQSGAPPVRGPRGELFYVARYGSASELHRLRPDGDDSVIADGFASAGVLAPQDDGRLLFVAARTGGVAGLWLADAGGARCLTNCELGRAPWGDAFVPPPGDAEAIRVVDGHARYRAFDGTERTIALAPAPRPSLPVEGDGPGVLEEAP